MADETEPASNGHDDTSTALLDQISTNLFPPQEKAEEPEPEVEADAPEPVAAPTATVAPIETPKDPIPLPKSWKESMGDLWNSIPQAAQDFYLKREQEMLKGLDTYKQDATFAKAVHQVLQPYQPLLTQLRLKPEQAIGNLIQAHQRLTQGTEESRWEALQQLAKDIGLHGRLAPPAPTGTSAPTADPLIQEIRDRQSRLEQGLLAQQQAAYTAAKAEVDKQVAAFAADPKNLYFEELQDDILKEIGFGFDLPTAYKRAVQHSDVVQAREQARIQTEAETKLKENARLNALPKKKAVSANVKHRDSARTPTEPLGTMEDTVRKLLKEKHAAVS